VGSDPKQRRADPNDRRSEVIWVRNPVQRSEECQACLSGHRSTVSMASHVLSDLSYSVQRGQIVRLADATGRAKSTTMKSSANWLRRAVVESRFSA